MKLIVRIGNKYDPFHLNFSKGWRDGQIIDIQPDDYQEGRMERKHFLVLQTPHDYLALRGSADLKSTKDSVLNLKKFLTPVDSQGKYPWEFGYLKDEKRVRARDWFIDIEKLLSDKWITKADHDGIRDFSREYGSISIDRPLMEYLVHEDVKGRLDPTIHNMAVASGTYSIGTTAADYATITAFEADIAATLTGNLTGEHQDEETAIGSMVVFDTETATHLLKLTAVSGAEHDGTAYGNGARVNYGTFDAINFDETTDGHLDDIEMSKLALDISGSGNTGVFLTDGMNSGEWTVNRMLIKGDADSLNGLNQQSSSGLLSGNLYITNNICYGIGEAAQEGGIIINPKHFGGDEPQVFLYNNTCIKNYWNFYQTNANSVSPEVRFSNNLAQGSTGGGDYGDDGGGWGSVTAKNISEDATGPDAAYDNTDVHTNSIFNDYANDDYTLDPAGDATNLAIADDGDDLSGIFTDDIIGQTRSTWYIGASEIVTAVVGAIPIFMRYYRNRRTPCC